MKRMVIWTGELLGYTTSLVGCNDDNVMMPIAPPPSYYVNRWGWALDVSLYRSPPMEKLLCILSSDLPGVSDRWTAQKHVHSYLLYEDASDALYQFDAYHADSEWVYDRLHHIPLEPGLPVVYMEDEFDRERLTAFLSECTDSERIERLCYDHLVGTDKYHWTWLTRDELRALAATHRLRADTISE